MSVVYVEQLLMHIGIIFVLRCKAGGSSLTVHTNLCSLFHNAECLYFFVKAS